MDVKIFANPHDPYKEGNSTGYLLDRLGSYLGSDPKVVFEPDASAVKDEEIVFLRHDIPLNKEFLRSLPQGARYVNDPNAILEYHTKDHLLGFLDLTVPTVISSDTSELSAFVQSYEDTVFKPLDENGGKGIVKISSGPTLEEEIETYLSSNDGMIIAQQYIDGVERLGDKRINVIDYEPVSAVLRMPQEGSFICNLGSGGTSVRSDLTKSDYEIVERIAPWLEANGLRWVGVDLIGSYLSEINVVSPGGLYRADHLNGNDRGIRSIKRLIDSLAS